MSTPLISDLIQLLEMFREEREKNKEKVNLALAAVSEALIATEEFYHEYNDGENNEAQGQLARLWRDASLAVRAIDRKYSRILDEKSYHHTVYGNPNEVGDSDYDISLKAVRKKYQELL